MHVAWQALYKTTLQGNVAFNGFFPSQLGNFSNLYGCKNEPNASFNAHLPYKLDDMSGGTSDLVSIKTFRHPVFQVMYSTCNA